ncbi:Acetyl-coenzyme A synthetase [Fasciola hepatica]|uniref:Acetyl-coenzyme A synthetase n=1 Tax=Fasciola hepatica TaxID=6192 RepID=A0A2H1C4E4_FASHE|nr:Acetyl-coenzyme A synthetase [Fasciola hepatica]
MLNISGHLVSTAEVESALLLHAHIAEAAVVSRKLPVKGECLHCFVPLKNNVDRNAKGAVNHVPVLDATLRSKLCQLIRKRIGPLVVPDHIQVIE